MDELTSEEQDVVKYFEGVALREQVPQKYVDKYSPTELYDMHQFGLELREQLLKENALETADKYTPIELYDMHQWGLKVMENTGIKLTGYGAVIPILFWEVAWAKINKY